MFVLTISDPVSNEFYQAHDEDITVLVKEAKYARSCNYPNIVIRPVEGIVSSPYSVWDLPWNYEPEEA